jgi:hypothetical protein
MPQTKVAEKIKTHFMLNNFFPKTVPVEIRRKKLATRDRPQMTI